jgi:hypothetical protein
MTNLQKRLKKLEDRMIPQQVPIRIWQIVLVDSDGSRQDGPLIEWSPTIQKSRCQ